MIESYPDGMVCANCEVITVPSGSGWVHPPALGAKFARTGVCDSPAPGRSPKPREMRFGRGASRHRDKYMVFGSVAGVPGPTIVATDGSYVLRTGPPVRKIVSWGYVSTTGSYGLGSSAPAGRVVGDKPTLVAELRGIFWGLRTVGIDRKVTVLTDSDDAVQMLAAWRTGSTVTPRGYSREPRADGSPALLLQLADAVRQRGELLTVTWTRSHIGEPLNEGADALGQLARTWGEGRLNKSTVRADAAAAARAALDRHAQG